MKKAMCKKCTLQRLETLNKFTSGFGLGLLEDAGRISHETAVEKAHNEYAAYSKQLPDELTEVEKAYLDTLRDMQKRLKDGGGNDE